MIHVFPVFGRAHDKSVWCWCKPRHDAKEPEVLIHKHEELPRQAQGQMIHVYPLFGRAHKCSPYCWCEPEPDAVEPDVLIHKPDKLACLYSC